MSTKTDKVKQHFKDHKDAYIAGGICLAVGTAVTYLVVKGYGCVTDSDESVKLINTIQGNTVQGDMHNTIINQLVRRGHPGNVIACVETGETWASQARAAEVIGCSATAMSRHLNGFQEHIKGKTFITLGEAT